jgi:hypothetical protein
LPWQQQQNLLDLAPLSGTGEDGTASLAAVAVVDYDDDGGEEDVYDAADGCDDVAVR